MLMYFFQQCFSRRKHGVRKKMRVTVLRELEFASFQFICVAPPATYHPKEQQEIHGTIKSKIKLIDRPTHSLRFWWPENKWRGQGIGLPCRLFVFRENKKKQGETVITGVSLCCERYLIWPDTELLM